MITLRDFFLAQLERARLRAWVLAHGIAAAVFWTAVAVGWTYAERAGAGWLGWIGIGLYVSLAIPFLVLQVILVADLLGYVVLGKIFAYPSLEKAVEEWRRTHPGPLRLPRKTRAFYVLADVSPLSSLALWSLVVLARMPDSVHGSLESRRKLERSEIDLERAVYASAVRRLRIA